MRTDKKYFQPLTYTLGYYLEDDWTYTLDMNVVSEWMSNNGDVILNFLSKYGSVDKLTQTLDELYPKDIDFSNEGLSVVLETIDVITGEVWDIWHSSQGHLKEAVTFIETSCIRDLRNNKIEKLLD